MKVKEVISAIIKKTGLEPISPDKTCDQFIAGDLESEVTGIVTTFMATVEVIRHAISIGANFIITHEPTWFSGLDNVDWLKDDPVYTEKKKLIEENHLNIWRFHDHMHLGKEDGIYRGFNQEFGWTEFLVDNPKGLEWFGRCYQIPKTTLRDLANFFKGKLAMDIIQIVGNPDMNVERVTVLVGGGSLGLGKEERPMIMMHQNNIDVAICGDITEWTLSAYIRDASQMGMNKGMLVLGHERSEEVGMKHLVPWLKDIVGGIDVKFVDSKEPFIYL